MTNKIDGRMYWRYEVRAIDGTVLKTGVIFAPNAASAAWHIARFLTDTEHVVVLPTSAAT